VIDEASVRERKQARQRLEDMSTALREELRVEDASPACRVSGVHFRPVDFARAALAGALDMQELVLVPENHSAACR